MYSKKIDVFSPIRFFNVLDHALRWYAALEWARKEKRRVGNTSTQKFYSDGSRNICIDVFRPRLC
jgi:hypothetical protein